VLLDFILASRLCDARVLIHAHELPTGLARYAFSALLRLADATMIYISDATRRSYVGLHSRRSATIWNGTAPKTASPPQRSGILHLLLIGRFNAWKGQPLLLDALALLTSEERALVRVRLLGSAFRGQEHFRQAIIDKIADHNLHDIVSLLDFDPAPDAHFAWADIVVVPSTRPEPFGLVAIEAMAAGRAVVASRHGGLEEIVVDGETGSLFTPADAQALADIIRCYLANRDLAEAQGRQGRERFAQHFDERVYKNRIAEAAGVLLAPRMAHLSAPATPTAAQTA
jgi:glycosyltransferase involved in cell wall biosynthesis